VFKIAKSFRFDAAHRLPLHKGKCKALHGHTYEVVLEFAAEDVDQKMAPTCGMVLDYGDIKTGPIAMIMKYMDHATILQESDPLTEVLLGPRPRAGHCGPNEYPLREEHGVAPALVGLPVKVYVLMDPPTAENLAKEIHGLVRAWLRDDNSPRGGYVHLAKVKVKETADTHAEYAG